jgi:hypothetical protein
VILRVRFHEERANITTPITTEASPLAPMADVNSFCAVVTSTDSDNTILSRHLNDRFAPKNETARAVGAAAWGAGVPAMDGRWERVA